MKSVHLENFPSNIFKKEIELTNQMDLAREVCSSALSIRKKFNLRARLPLSKLTIIGENALSLESFKQFIMEETNVKKIILDPNFARETKTKLEILFEKVGKKFGKKMPEILKASKSGNWKRLSNGCVLIAEEILSTEDFTIKLIPTFQGENFESVGSDFVVVLDVQTNEELEMEGLARDFVRIVQNQRKLEKLEINDFISIFYEGDKRFEKMLSMNAGYIKEQCLVKEFIKSKPDKTFISAELEDLEGFLKIIKA